MTWKVMFMAILAGLLASGPVQGETPPKAAEATAVPAEMQETPPARPEDPTGYFPGLLPPSPYGALELGTTGGVLAPYGNGAAYDSLLRGWRSHRLGKATVTPYFEVDGLYRSNIYLTPTDKKSDFIWLLVPGLRLELPLAGRHRLSVGYLGNYFIYTKYSNDSHYDQNINTDLTLNLKGNLTLRLGNTVRLATEERNSEFAVQRVYSRTTPYITAGYILADRCKLEGTYQFDTLHFAKSVDQINDYHQHNAGVTLYYRFWPKTAALVQYIFTYRQYPDNRSDDNHSHSPLVGLTWDPTAKLSGAVKAGYTFKQYDASVEGRNNSPENWILSAQLLYRFSRYTTLSLRAQRSFQEDLDFGNSGYRNTGVWVSLNHDWHYFRVSSYASFFYLNNDYLNPTFDASGQFLRRLDNIVGSGVGVSRPLTRWLRVRLDYIYSNRNSNFFGYSYNDHKLLAGLQTSF